MSRNYAKEYDEECAREKLLRGAKQIFTGSFPGFRVVINNKVIALCHTSSYEIQRPLYLQVRGSNSIIVTVALTANNQAVIENFLKPDVTYDVELYDREFAFSQKSARPGMRYMRSGVPSPDMKIEFYGRVDLKKKEKSDEQQ